MKLLVPRICWAALLLGQLVFLAIIPVLMPRLAADPTIHPVPILSLVSAVTLVACIPMGLFIRRITFSQGRTDYGIRPSSYFTGNLIFWAMCEGPSFLSLITIIVNKSFMPTIIFAVIAMGVQALTFPTGNGVDQT